MRKGSRTEGRWNRLENISENLRWYQQVLFHALCFVLGVMQYFRYFMVLFLF